MPFRRLRRSSSSPPVFRLFGHILKQPRRTLRHPDGSHSPEAFALKQLPAEPVPGAYAGDQEREDPLFCGARNRAAEQPAEVVAIAGKCCESGDLIGTEFNLPEAKIGDIVAVLSTGAYNYSMASNYNRNFIPAAVLVRDGRAEYIIRPQTYEDLVRNDVIPAHLK